MKVYLCGPYANKLIFREQIAPRLIEAGHQVVSSWITESGPDFADLDADLDGGRVRLHLLDLARETALKNLQEISQADVVVRAGSSERGGAATEWGVALALHKRLIVMCRRINVFDWLPQVERVPDINCLIAALEE